MPSSSLPSAEPTASLLPLANHLAARAALTALQGLHDTITGVNNRTLATTTDSDTADSLSHFFSSLSLAQRAAVLPALADYLVTRASLTAREALRDAITGVNNRRLATTTDSDTADSLSHLLSSLTLAQRAAVLPALADYLATRASLTARVALSDAITGVNNRRLATTTDSLDHLPPSYEEATAGGLPTYEESIARENPATALQTVGQPEVAPQPAYRRSPSPQR